MSVDVLKDFFYKFLDLDHWNSKEEDKAQVEKLMTRINEISNIILEQSNETDKTKVKALQEKFKSFSYFYSNLDQRTEISNDASTLSDDSD